MFNTYITHVTPEKAAQMLQGHVSNQEWFGADFKQRKLRTAHVKHLANQMEKKRWKTTPVPIVLTKRSRVIVDGQHRLEAIVLSGVTVEVTVTEVDDEVSKSIFEVIDQNKTRSLEDITGEHPKVVKPLTYLLRAATKIHSPTAADLYPFLNSPLGTLLKGFNEEKSSTKLWKTTQFLAALVIAIQADIISYHDATALYKKLCNDPIGEWPPIFATLYCKLIEHPMTMRSGKSLEHDVFMRSYYALSHFKLHTKTIRIHRSFINEMKADVFATLYQISPETFD